MNTNATIKALDALESVKDLIKIDFNNGGKNMDYVHVINPETHQTCSFWTNTWAGDELVELSEVITAWACGEWSWKRLCHYDDSKAVSDNFTATIRNAHRIYVKDSYKTTQGNLQELVRLYANEYGIKKDYISQFEMWNARKNLNDVFEIDGMYITTDLINDLKTSLKNIDCKIDVSEVIKKIARV